MIAVFRNRWKAYACGHGPRFAVRSRHLGKTAVPSPLSWRSCHVLLASFTTPSISSCRCAKSVTVVRYDRARRAIQKLVAKSGLNPQEFAFHSLRTGGATTVAAGSDTLESVIQREGRCKSDPCNAYTRNTINYSITCHVSSWWQAKGGGDSRGQEQCGTRNGH